MRRALLLVLLASSAAFGQGEPPAAAAADLSGVVPTTRTVSAGDGLSGGGDLSANRSLACVAASGVANGCVTTGTQTLNGDKTFQGTLTVSADGGNTFVISDGTNSAWMKPGATNSVQFQGGATFNGAIQMPALTSISWPAGAAGVTQGAGQYTGTCVPMQNGASWPISYVTLFHTGTVAANVSTGETTLQQLLHTNQFGNDASVAGRGWVVTAWGTFAANNNAKTVKLKLGPTQTDVTGGLFTGTTGTNNTSWKLTCFFVRSTGTSAQVANCEWRYGTVTGVTTTAPTEATATIDWTITLTGTGGASNDIANAIMRVDWVG